MKTLAEKNILLRVIDRKGKHVDISCGDCLSERETGYYGNKTNSEKLVIRAEINSKEIGKSVFGPLLTGTYGPTNRLP